MAPTLLLIDDDPQLVVAQVKRALPSPDMQVEVARTGKEAVALASRRRPDLALLDVSLPDMDGLEVYRRLREIDARIPVIFATATTSAETAIEAMRHGAFDYLFKPLDLLKLKEVLAQANELGRLMREPAVMAADPDNQADPQKGDAIIGRCAAMADVYKAIGRVADQNVIVLITGESGTGKELVARAIYQHSRRADKPFLAINCAAIPESLLESELFGHEKGAFTGADRRRIGKFEQCNGGTLFLDEIGDMPLSTQGKILRLLQDQTFERVGGSETITTDVRLIAATNRDLKTMSEQGRFRPDLYYRLSVFSIPLPALRERGDDIPLLVSYYLRRFNRELGRDIREAAPEAIAQLRSYAWPGNIRQLQSVLKQALLHASGNVLIPAFLPPLSQDRAAPTSATAGAGSEGQLQLESFIRERLAAGTTDLQAEVSQEVDRLLLPAVLRFTGGNQQSAAKALGVSRQTLRLRLRELDITVTKTVDEGEADSPQ
jgi:two-component system nitrogen regulation response regulator GlnG